MSFFEGPRWHSLSIVITRDAAIGRWKDTYKEEEHNPFLPGIKTEILQEAQVSFPKALPQAKKPGLLLVTVNVIMLTVKRSRVEKKWLPSFSMAAEMSTTGTLMLNSVFPFENEHQWISEVQNTSTLPCIKTLV